MRNSSYAALLMRNSPYAYTSLQEGGVVQWVARLTRNVEVFGSSPSKKPPLFPWARNFTLVDRYVMDKIWDRNPSKSEVIGRCGGDKKNE